MGIPDGSDPAENVVNKGIVCIGGVPDEMSDTGTAVGFVDKSEYDTVGGADTLENVPTGGVDAEGAASVVPVDATVLVAEDPGAMLVPVAPTTLDDVACLATC